LDTDRSDGLEEVVVGEREREGGKGSVGEETRNERVSASARAKLVGFAGEMERVLTAGKVSGEVEVWVKWKSELIEVEPAKV